MKAMIEVCDKCGQIVLSGVPHNCGTEFWVQSIPFSDEHEYIKIVAQNTDDAATRYALRTYYDMDFDRGTWDTTVYVQPCGMDNVVHTVNVRVQLVPQAVILDKTVAIDT